MIAGVLPLRACTRDFRVYRGEHPETTAIEASFPQTKQIKNEKRHENNEDER